MRSGVRVRARFGLFSAGVIGDGVHGHPGTSRD